MDNPLTNQDQGYPYAHKQTAEKEVGIHRCFSLSLSMAWANS